MGLVAGIIAFLFFEASPSFVSSEMAVEIFRVISEIDGVLIGFTGIIAVFIIKGTPKKERSEIGLGISVVIMYFVGSVLFNLNGLMNVNSASISSLYFFMPITLLNSGIFFLALILYRALV